MQNLAARAHHPAARVAKAQMKQLRIGAAVLLAPTRAPIAGRQDQSLVANDIAVVFIDELYRVEIDKITLLSITIVQRIAAADEAAPVIGAAQNHSLIADD